MELKVFDYDEMKRLKGFDKFLAKKRYEAWRKKQRKLDRQAVRRTYIKIYQFRNKINPFDFNIRKLSSKTFVIDKENVFRTVVWATKDGGFEVNNRIMGNKYNYKSVTPKS